MSRYLEERRSVLGACLALADRGFLPGTGGNVAIRVANDAFAVTPSAADYYSMQPEDICILNLETLEQIEGDKKPSVESGLHARLLRFRKDLHASIHTHQPVASAVTLLNRSLTVEDPEHRKAIGPTVPIVPYAPSGTSFLAKAFGRSLKPNLNAYLLRNHGIVCGGETLETAMEHVAILEQVAAQFLKRNITKSATAAGSPVATLLLNSLN